MKTAVTHTRIPGLAEPRRGKVRDIYDLGDTLLIVSTDRISAFDWILPTGIPDKGRVLNGLSVFWLTEILTNIDSHFISENVADIIDSLPDEAKETAPIQDLLGRSMLVRKMEVIPVECVVRGYLAGSGWKEYQQNGTVCGNVLPDGLQQCARLDCPIFTPSTKAEAGHDQNMTFDQMIRYLKETVHLEKYWGDGLRILSIHAFRKGSQHAKKHGLILADTKFEFGLTADKAIVLIDEALTPDSSRFWLANSYEPGRDQTSLDKQFVRDWLTNEAHWDRNSPPPALPDEVVAQTRERYVAAFEQLTSQSFPWK